MLDIVKAFSKVNNIEIPYDIKPRRAGDIAECYADPTKAYEILGWKAEKILKICAVTLGTGNFIILMVTNDRKNNLVFVQLTKITQIYKNNSQKCQNQLTFGEFIYIIE